MFNTEKISMELIAGAGEGRSYAFQALQSAREKDFEKADELLKTADESIKNAHVAQTQLMVKEAQGEKADMNVLLVHAQDHLMTAELAIDLIKEMVEIMRGNEK